jgi:hypothetical protein
MPSLAELIGNYEDPRSWGSRLRRRRARVLIRVIQSTYEERGRCTVLDLGGVESYWRAVDREFLHDMGCHITLLNIAAQAIDDTRLFTYRRGDATAVDSQDGAFDIVHSNSVIEHLGSWRKMRQFSEEVRRLGHRYLVQTPNFWFPWEPHFGLPFFHFLPRPSRVALLMRRPCGFFDRCGDIWTALEAVDGVRLLDATMMRDLFPGADIVRERILGMTKSLMAVKG